MFVRVDDNFVVNTDKICSVDMYPKDVTVMNQHSTGTHKEKYTMVALCMVESGRVEWNFKNEEDAKEFYNNILHQLGVKNED